MITLLLTLLTLTFARKGYGQGELENVQEFGILCRVYGVAKKLPPQTDATAERRARRLLKDISDVFLLAAANDSHYEAESSTIGGAVSKSCERIKGNIQKKPFTGKMRRILDVAASRMEQIQRNVREEGQTVTQIQEALLKAIYGKAVKSEPDGDGAVTSIDPEVFGAAATSLGTNGEKNCGGAGADGNGAHVGVSLVNDFFCLCVMGSTHSKWCHLEVAESGKGNNWKSGLGSAQTEWALIKQKCPPIGGNLTVEAIEQAILVFHSALGGSTMGSLSGDSTNKIAGYILGRANAVATGCTGAQSQVCVNYKNNLVAKAGTPRGIPWEERMREASTGLRELESKRRQNAALVTQLELLNHSAWDVCGEAWDYLEDVQRTSRVAAGNISGPTTMKNDLSGSGISGDSAATNSKEETHLVFSALLNCFLLITVA